MKKTIIVFLCIISQLTYGQSVEYPKTRKTTIIDTLFSIAIIDDYRWFENTKSAEVTEWIEQQNDITNKYLKKPSLKINSYKAIDRYSFVKYHNAYKDRKYYFNYGHYDNVGVPALFYKKHLMENSSLLVDPNYISNKEVIRLQNYKVSKDSKLLAYQFNRNGSDWGEIKVVNLENEKDLPDHLTNVKFSGIAWRGDGFYYSKYPTATLEQSIGQQIFYHKIGTDQSEDILIFKRSNNPEAQFSCKTTNDERFLIINERDESKGVVNVFYIDYNSTNPALRPLITRLSIGENFSVLENKGDTLIAITFKDGNNGMLIKIDINNPRQWNTFIPEYSSALLLETKMMDNVILNTYQSNKKQQIVFYNYEGNVVHAIDIPAGFSVEGFNGDMSDKEILFTYEGYTQPKIVYQINLENFEMKPVKATEVNYDFTKYKTKELEYESFDGIKVPMFIVYKDDIDLTKPNPVLLKAYGGFGVIATPHFSPGIVQFLSHGGIYAFANIRGGGDKGKAWAEAGRGANKMTSFKDFIAASEYLINSKMTTPNQLGISGASNGGLVVAAAMTIRPELYGAVIPEVAPLDMVRFENFTIGVFHRDEYGTANDSLGLLNLLSYSPLHNIKPDVNYPPTMIVTSDNDDRVPPLHSYKFAAKLQNREAQKNPIILRVEKNAGHYGASKSFKSKLKEEACFYDFLIYHLMNK